MEVVGFRIPTGNSDIVSVVLPPAPLSTPLYKVIIISLTGAFDVVLSFRQREKKNMEARIKIFGSKSKPETNII